MDERFSLAALRAGLRADHHGAMQPLYELYAGPLYRWSIVQLGNAEAAHDVVQAAFYGIPG